MSKKQEELLKQFDSLAEESFTNKLKNFLVIINICLFELKVTGSFAAAHKLQMVAKKCENLHGHNWKVEACVKGSGLSNAGVLIDFGILKISQSNS